MAQRRALARLAWRSMATAPLRSVLIIAVVALLVGGSAGWAVFERSTRATPVDFIETVFGSANTVMQFSATPVVDQGSPRMLLDDESVEQWIQAFDARSGVDGLAELFDQPIAVERRADLVVQEAQGRGPFLRGPSSSLPTLVGADFSDPLIASRFVLVEGRFPAAVDEVAVAARLARDANYEVGDTIMIDDRALRLVGEIEIPVTANSRVALVPTLSFDDFDISPRSLEYQLLATAPFTEVGRVADEVESVVGHRIAVAHTQRLMQRGPDGGWAATDEAIDLSLSLNREVEFFIYTSALAIGLGMAGMAIGAMVFAITIRRRTTTLGQLVSVGATGPHLRRMLRYEAGWLGLIGSIIGIGAGLAGAWLVLRANWFAESYDRLYTGLRVRPQDLAGPAIVGVFVVCAAASWPAAKLDAWSASAAVAGQPPTVPSSARSRLRTAVVCLAVAFMIPVVFSNLGGARDVLVPTVILGTIMAAIGGYVMMKVVLEAAAARADRFPLIARLVARITARASVRSGLAIATLALTLAVPVVMAVAFELDPTWNQDTITAGSYGSTSSTPTERVITQSGPGSRSRSDDAYTGRVFTVEAILNAEPDGTAARNMVDDLAAVHADLVEAAQLRFDLLGTTDLVQVVAELYTETSANEYYRVGTPTLYIATDRVVELLQLDEITQDALANGMVVDISGQTWLSDGQPVIREASTQSVFQRPSTQPVEVLQGPQVFAERGVLLVDAERASELGIDSFEVGSLFVLGSRAETDELDAFVADADDAWVERFDRFARVDYAGDDVFAPNRPAEVFYDRQYGNEVVPTAAVLIAAVLAAMVALGIAALSAVEFDNESSLLVAVGANPTLRRKFVATQTFYYLATAAVVGLPIALTMINLGHRFVGTGPIMIAIPWRVIGLVGIVVPLLITALIALLFRNGTPAVSRRIA